jgi:biopolymer transport protein ExbD
MAEKRRFLDVWLVEPNTVYQEVPFAVVCDWIQQGRLLAEDKYKPSGTKEWLPLGDAPELAPYLPHPEPYRAEDQAEALEPVQVDFAWKKPHDHPDEDVDMIPLIDVSLVLLIFFMLSAAGVGAAAFVPTPATEYAQTANNPNVLRIDVGLDRRGDPAYSFAFGNQAAEEADRNFSDFQLFRQRLEAVLKKREGGPYEAVINAHKDLKSEHTRYLLGVLGTEPLRSKVRVSYYGVSEKKG